VKFVFAARAAISFGVGIFITFNQSHSAATGLLSLAIFGIGYALLNGVGSTLWGKGIFSLENFPLTLAALIVGLAALLVPAYRSRSFGPGLCLSCDWLGTNFRSF
jgi:hypothetical protein